MTEIKLGTTFSVSTIVDESNIASTVGSGLLPVFATPMMIAQMEKAASELLAPFLEKTQTSVGIKIDVSHDKASPIGATIITTAKIIAVDRRQNDFEVISKDEKSLIGKGFHSRFIIDSQKFLEKLK
ncbi:MAG: thioesterase family protein [Streptococcaceae bacterium]|nr:thioesterase family protein [Streptococcaceae bacterium]